MNHLQLKQIRQLLFLSTKEAASLSSATIRSWQRYEDGTRSFPKEVKSKMIKLIEKRNRLISNFDESNPNCRFFETLDAFWEAGGRGDLIDWRIAQSVSAEVLSKKLKLE
ncbi:DUF1870 family protein [Vibrio cholerae]|nr:DUF1870 family protein [Vibrio cholerae]